MENVIIGTEITEGGQALLDAMQKWGSSSGYVGSGPGATPALKSASTLPAGAVVRLAFAGGGGYGRPEDREREAIDRDLAEGLITAESAVRDYGLEMQAGE
jgi:N-methylhydantoinase B